MRCPRGWCWFVVAAVLAASLAVGGAPATAGEAVERDDSIAALLEARRTALVAGDRDGWLAAVDPSAPPAFFDAQGAMFDGLRAVGVSDVSLQVDEAVGDLSPPGASERHGAPTYVPATELRYRIAGYDDRDVLDVLWWTYVERGGSWFVAADDDLEVVGLSTQRQLWDFGPVEALRASERVLVLSHPGRSVRAAEVAGLLDEALARFDQRWRQPWDGSVVVVVPDRADEVEEILQTTLDLDNFVAFVSYRIDRDDGYVATAERMFLNDERLSQRTREFQVDTLVHELAHAAAAGAVGPFIDSWVHEGYSEWIADGRPSGLPLPAGSDGAIPDRFEFRTGSRAEIVRSYDEATSAMAHLARLFGDDAPDRFFTSLGSRRIVAGTTEHHIDATLRAEFDLTLEAFEASWASAG